MYTAKDFIGKNIAPKNLSIGWKIVVEGRKIALTYTILNFDWSSINQLSFEDSEKFLTSKSYETMMKKLKRCGKKFKRTYYDAFSISDLKFFVEDDGLDINVEKMVLKVIKEKSKKLKKTLDNE